MKLQQGMPLHRTAEVVTVTLNPAVDETVFLEELRPGSVNRATRLHRQAGGKGVNVSSMLGGYGIPNVATGFLGRENPRLFEELFSARGIRDEFLRIRGSTRSGIKIVEQSAGRTTDINFDGLEPDAADLDTLMRKLGGLAGPGMWVVIGGRLPAGVSLGFFRDLLVMLKRTGAKIAADTSGEALSAAIECGVDLIKPNQHELEEVLGRELPDFAACAAAALQLQRERIPRVILSLGQAGALFLSPEAALRARSPQVRVVSTVGAGDSLLAGYLAGLVTGRSAEECAGLATVFAGCALEDVARTPPTPELAEERMDLIEVRPLVA
jgi:1-phosphofructokinase